MLYYYESSVFVKSSLIAKLPHYRIVSYPLFSSFLLLTQALSLQNFPHYKDVLLKLHHDKSSVVINGQITVIRSAIVQVMMTN